MTWLNITKSKKMKEQLKEFEEIILFADKQNKLNHLNLRLLINTLGKEAQWKNISKCIYQKESTLSAWNKIDDLFFSFLIKSHEISSPYKSLIRPIKPHSELVSLQEDIIITKPWNKERLLNSISSTGEYKTIDNWTQDNNHQVKLYLPFRIAIVTSGNHSIARGIIDSNEKLKTNDIYDCSELLKFVSSDGYYFYETNSKIKIQKVKDVKFAAIWEISKKLIKT